MASATAPPAAGGTACVPGRDGSEHEAHALRREALDHQAGEKDGTSS